MKAKVVRACNKSIGVGRFVVLVASLVAAVAPQSAAVAARAAPKVTGRLALLAGNGIDVVDLRTGRYTRPTNDYADQVAWSKNGSKLAYSMWSWDRPSTIETIKPDGAGRRTVVSMDATMLSWPSWSPDGKRLVFIVDYTTDVLGTAHAYLELWMVSADGRGLHRVTVPAGDVPDEPAWSPDGRRVAYSAVTPGPISEARFTTVKILDLARGTSTTVGPGAEPAWSPDGRRIALVAADNGIDVVNVVTHKRTRLDAGQGLAYDRSPTFSPDGRWVAYSRADQGEAQLSGQAHIWVSPADGSKAAAPLDMTGFSVAWGPAA